MLRIARDQEWRAVTTSDDVWAGGGGVAMLEEDDSSNPGRGDVPCSASVPPIAPASA